jgi:hypothetical protein
MSLSLRLSKDSSDYATVFSKGELKSILERRESSVHFSKKEKEWINPYQKNLLSLLVEFSIHTCDLRAFPYKHEIEVYVRNPDGPSGGGPYRTIRYKEGEEFQEIAKKIAQAATDFWQEFIREPVKNARIVFKQCKEFTEKEVRI